MGIRKTEWRFAVHVVHYKTDRGPAGLIVEAWDKDYAGNKNGNDLLWTATTDANGKCEGAFTKERFHDRHNKTGRRWNLFV